jgi:lipid II isoglutaminyl synthase (glutamine-hydrolysing)
MTGESTITIGLLLPEVLGTYSDAGNATVLAQRLRWRGIHAEIRPITADTVAPASCDMYVLGGGEDTAEMFAVDWLAAHPHLLHAIADRVQTLAVCAGLQILGRSMRDRGGHDYPGLGILDISTAPGGRRAVGQIITSCTIPGVGELTGFENHLGVTTLGRDSHRLADVVTGTGNGTRNENGNRTEGVLTDHIIGTYLHGPILARNPALADHILHRTTGLDLVPLDLPDQAPLRQTYLGPSARRTRRRARSRLPRALSAGG